MAISNKRGARERPFCLMRSTFFALAVCLTLTGCAHAVDAPHRTVKASWYGGGEHLNRHTANGDPFNASALTAAHRSFPFGTRLALTNPANGRTITVRVNDRGPFVPGRSLDLTRGAADALGFRLRGTASLTMRVLP